MNNKVKIIECPRDAMQGIKEFIPTELKTAYLNSLLKVGFDTIDFGSFVSPKAIPQLKDTAEVLAGLNLDDTKSSLLSIVANKRGAEDACNFEEIEFMGYPFSVSETFQQRNTNASIDQSLKRVDEIQELAIKHKKKLVVYLSMAFGNPYGDAWDVEEVAKWSERLHNDLGIRILALSDTIGVSNPDNINYLFSTLIPEFSEVEFGAHLHTTPNTWKEKVDAAYNSGCLRFDGAIKGYGGCPMATDDLTGNMATENMLAYFNENKISHKTNMDLFNETMVKSNGIFLQYH
jgi:hydroxymethylglutaryl-CoA lyase